MLSKKKILGLIDSLLIEKELFIISLEINTANNIKLIVDSMKGVGIAECVALSRAIEHNLDRDEEDFELEVFSAGLTEPYTIKEQYLKNIGNEIEVVLKAGSKEKGILCAVNDEDFSIEQEKKVKVEGKKKKQQIKEIMSFTYAECSKVKSVIKF